MRLHLVIQRHGLPVTRILWTTAPPSLYAGRSSSGVPAASSALLEDVNEVIPLETEPALFDDEYSGQWGLEDYVVETGGSECLHFMEVEGLLRDGDEVVIRALEVADLRARRLSGRHQISNDGKHLIDGVPFGKPFLKRSTASRPAITIPPRKRRRTTHAAWENRLAYGDEDVEWHPGAPSRSQELSVIRPSHAVHQKRNDHYEDEFEDYHDNGDRTREEDPDAGDATVIHHRLDEGASGLPADDLEDYGDAQESGSEHPSEDISELEGTDMVDELEGLKEEMELSQLAANGVVDFNQAPHTGPYQLRARAGEAEPKARKSSLSKHVADDSSRRDSKAVRFQGQGQVQKEKSPAPQPEKRLVSKAGSTSDEESANSSSDSSASDSSASSSDSDSDSDSSASAQSNSNASTSVTDTSSSSSSESDSSDSDSDSTTAPETKITLRKTTTNPPGRGSTRTKKSNLRTKLRRRLSKLKELGALSAEADFTALREFEELHGHQYYTDETTMTKKQQEQAEFEARRQKLLRDLASGGVDISETATTTSTIGKENEAPRKSTRKESTQRAEQSAAESTPSEEEDEDEGPEEAHSKRRTLDVASSRRMVFGSLGVRTPQSKEDEEKTRKKLAGKVNHFLPRQLAVEKPEPTPVVSDDEGSWEDKLIVRATECVFDDVELTAPPYPFEQRWDREAAYRIKQLKGPSKKRRRKQKTQEYEVQEDYGNGGYENGDGYWEGDYGNEGYEYGNEDWNEDYGNGEGYEEGNTELNYDEAGLENGDAVMEGTEQPAETEEDLPSMPENPSSLPALVETDVKKGAVIAYKELDMSKATNWQPIVSEYRVAEVHDILDNAFNLRLAARDRKAIRETEDDEDDEPEYSGFEMPGYDEDAEDDGFREKSFGDLIDPKLLRAAECADPGEAGDASMSSASRARRGRNSSVLESSMMQDHGDEERLDVGGERSAPTSPVRSPEFMGFESPPPPESSKSDTNTEPQAPDSQAEPAVVEPGENPDGPQSQNQKDDSHSTVPPNRSKVDPPTMPSDDDLQMMSSPGSVVSFSRLISSLHEKEPSESDTTKPNEEKPCSPRPASPSSTTSVVPNPFYEIDKQHEDTEPDSTSSQRRTRRSLKRSQAAETSASTPPARKAPRRSSQRRKTAQSQEDSLITSIPDSMVDAQPPPTQESGVFVDLTQSSPLASPGGSDVDFAKSHRLPRGSGWVQKDLPPRTTRRQTRSSVSGSTFARRRARSRV
ncbi:hypothetical protein P168DRAFT_313392 [Aspergillus campestris IBT 28561]|uniref:Uncharacterized protein n=1 Tax=Aspergillus campestris (strain IBT 28561) TaxID=1392248 RepID=A0A2I1CSL2_ASPC2|nr:uncharacterized protein P168DRAFT_313392 [Aspergillus campestris IBT 28561]PKY00609.1 hypothetical protein P168DRAFT_313392 [Aspergillus campestris IBT 28561]